MDSCKYEICNFAFLTFSGLKGLRDFRQFFCFVKFHYQGMAYLSSHHGRTVVFEFNEIEMLTKLQLQAPQLFETVRHY